jgi:predicted MFS family arabinose efflux permease
VPTLVVLLGLAFYIVPNPLQSNATQVAPEARVPCVSMFAFAFFAGQSPGVAAAAPVIDRLGAPAVHVAAAMLLPLVAAWCRVRLARRPAA